MKTKKPVISVKGLCKDFHVGKDTIVPVLKKIDLDIFYGEFVIIFGPSGCGKSTLLNTIIGLEPPTSGKVDIRGVDLYQKKEDDRAKFRHDKFGIIYQQPNWLKALNVQENVALPLNIAGMGERRALKRAANILDLLGLVEYKKYTPTELSGGQQQKVAMARAFVSNPWIIIADEPTGNLDTISAMDVMNVFKYVNDESRRTILMVTHNLEYEKFATKVVYMRDGEIEKIVDKKKVNLGGEEQPKDLLEMALES